MSDWRRKAERRAEREAEERERNERRRREQAECSHANCAPSQWSFDTGEVLEMQCSDCGATNWVSK